MLLSWILAGVVELRATRIRRSGGLPDVVTLGLIGQGLGFGLFSQRDAISDWLSVYAANLLIIWAISSLYLGVENRRGADGSLPVAVLLPGAIALLYPLIGLSDKTLVERVAIHAIVACTGYVIVIVGALSALERGRRLGPLVIVAALLAVIGAQVQRAVTMIDQHRGDLFAAQPPQTAYAMIILVGFFVTVVGYILMLAPREPPSPRIEERP
jgi:ABC-type transport system involved in cytochrome c biogenesis permease subunit